MKGPIMETRIPVASGIMIRSTTGTAQTSSSIYSGIRRIGGDITCPIGDGTDGVIPGMNGGIPITDTRAGPGIHPGTPKGMGAGTTTHSIAIGEAITGAAVIHRPK